MVYPGEFLLVSYLVCQFYFNEIKKLESLTLRWLDIVMLTNTLKRQIEVFTQILLAIMFTTNSYVKYRMLHVMQDADDISGVKTGELHPDVLIC